MSGEQTVKHGTKGCGCRSAMALQALSTSSSKLGRPPSGGREGSGARFAGGLRAISRSGGDDKVLGTLAAVSGLTFGCDC